MAEKKRNGNNLNWQIVLGVSLLALSAALYLVDYAIFRDKRGMFNYILMETAFIPVQVLLVTLIISGFLDAREKKMLLKKMNMVIGVFFSEAGTALVRDLNEFCPDINKLRREMMVDATWTDARFSQTKKLLFKQEFRIDSQKGNLERLRLSLLEKREFFMGLLENPNLLEHDSFTELLWAVFHLAEELASRKDIRQTSDEDFYHLSSDIQRAYHLLLIEWLAYMQHLKHEYPYLFSLAVRINPFDPQARAEIKQ